MFEVAEVEQKVSKEAFAAVAPELRLALIDAQQALRKADFPVFVIFAGVDGAGKSEIANLLGEWMDPRWIVTRAYDAPTEDEAARPPFWRFWRDLPGSGRIGVYLSAWYSRPLVERAHGRLKRSAFDRELDRIAAFEQTLADDGALFLKFWMHLDKAAQRKVLKKLEKTPLQHWKITDSHWANWRRYDKFVAAAEQIIRRTSTGWAPWRIIDGRDSRYRTLTVLTAIRDRVGEHVAERSAGFEKAGGDSSPVPTASGPEAPRTDSVLTRLDLGQSVAPKPYGREVRALRARLNRLYQKGRDKGVSAALVFEGWDAAGKGGTIRRLVAALDARDYRIHSYAAPTDEERAHHYLWRFWRHVPPAGKYAIFDRSWYGRVLVERIEGFAAEPKWRRAYAEINEFESRLVDHGILLLKYWLHIDRDEQERRFLARRDTPYKSWKLTDEDWRNRDRWDAYEAAVNEMVERTSTRDAPWVLVEANDKRFARLKVMGALCDALETRLGRAPREPKGRP